VFAWAQAAHNLPAWYGLGTALEQWRDNAPERLARLQAMYLEWPFFRNLLDNVQMALAKADTDIAAHYAELCEDRERGQRVFALIRDEYSRCLVQVLNIVESHHPLANTLPLARSIARRNPYLEPLHHIQVVLMKRCRESAELNGSPWLDPMLRSLNAIAAGTRNTG
jgi:phosphoenolpyruvate carboxylase